MDKKGNESPPIDNHGAPHTEDQYTCASWSSSPRHHLSQSLPSMTTLSTLPIAAAPTIALRQDGAGLRWRAEGSRCATLDSLATSDQCHSNNPNNTSNSDNVNNNNSSSSGSSSDDDRDVLEMAMRPASIKLGSTKPTNYGNAVSDLGSSNGRCSGHDLYQTSGVVNEQRQRAVQFQDMVSLAVHSINRVANLDQAESARATGDSPIDSNGTYTTTAKEARAIRAAAMASPGPFGSVFPASDDSGGNDKSPSQLYDFEKGMADTSAANLPSVDHSSLFRHKQMMRRRQQQRRRPGLLSHYLRLGQLSNRLRIRDALGLDHDDYYPTTDDETVVQSHQMDTGRGDASVPPALSPRSREWGPQFRRRRRRPGQSLRPVTAGNRWLHLFRRRTRSVPNNLAANTDQQRAGISPPQPYERPSLMFRPFERLTGALPYVGSSRQLAAAAAIASKSSAPQTTTATAFGTPLVTVGRRPLPSGAGTPLPPPPSDQLTTEKFGATAAGGGSGVGGDYFGIQHHDNPLSASPSAMQIALEQAAIEDAIRMLLLHQRFVILLAKAFMMYGSPLHHMESNLSRMADFLDLEASFSVLPGMIIISFDDSITHTSETKIIRCQNGWDMHRMHLTNKLFTRVVHGELDVTRAVEELEGIISAVPIYPWYVQIINWGLASWSVCLLAFNGSWVDSAVSFGLGVVMGVLSLGAATKLSGYANLFEVSCSIISGFIATALQRWVCYGSITLAGTVVILPGLLMTTGVIELSSRHLVAGTVRLFYALLLAVIIAFGLFFGNQFYVQVFEGHHGGVGQLDWVNSVQIENCHGLSEWWIFFTLPAAVTSICVLVNIHWRHFFSVNLLAGCMYAANWVIGSYLGMPDLAPTIASFVLGLLANAWCKWTKETVFMVLLPGEMILVPGSVGVRGLSMLFAQQSEEGIRLTLLMIKTSLSIMTGLFASTFVMYPRGRKRSALLTV